MSSEEITETYQKAMERIKAQSPEDRDLALQSLKWILTATRVLIAQELRHALAIDPEEDNIDDDTLSAVEDIISASASLIEVDEESQTIHLVHFTAEEFFQQASPPRFPTANLDLATACIDYVSMDILRKVDSWLGRDNLKQSYPLFTYVIQNLGPHMQSGLKDENAQACLKAIDRLQSSPEALFGMLSSLPRGFNGYLIHPLPCHIKFPSVRITTLNEWPKIIKVICSQEPGASMSLDSFYSNPIQIAACNGNEASLRCLLRDYSSMGNCLPLEKSPLLYLAQSQYGLKNTGPCMKLLLGAGADVHAINELRLPPLHLVARGRNEQVESASLLLQYGAKVFEQDHGATTALMWAAKIGHLELSKLLIRHGADINCKDKSGQTAFLWAINAAQIETSKSPLEHGADMNDGDDSGRTAVFWAVKGRSPTEMVKFLLTKGARMDIKAHKGDEIGMSVLICSAQRGLSGCIKALLENGARLDDMNMDGIPIPNNTTKGQDLGLIRFVINETAKWR